MDLAIGKDIESRARIVAHPTTLVAGPREPITAGLLKPFRNGGGQVRLFRLGCGWPFSDSPLLLKFGRGRIERQGRSHFDTRCLKLRGKRSGQFRPGGFAWGRLQPGDRFGIQAMVRGRLLKLSAIGLKYLCASLMKHSCLIAERLGIHFHIRSQMLGNAQPFIRRLCVV